MAEQYVRQRVGKRKIFSFHIENNAEICSCEVWEKERRKEEIYCAPVESQPQFIVNL